MNNQQPTIIHNIYLSFEFNIWNLETISEAQLK